MAWIKKAEHEGWSNYETWAYNLWLMNDQGSANWVTEVVQEALKIHYPDTDSSILDVMHALKNQLEDGAPEIGNSVYSDILNAGIGEVDCYEIAKSHVDQYINDNKDELKQNKKQEKE